VYDGCPSRAACASCCADVLCAHSPPPLHTGAFCCLFCLQVRYERRMLRLTITCLIWLLLVIVWVSVNSSRIFRVSHSLDLNTNLQIDVAGCDVRFTAGAHACKHPQQFQSSSQVCTLRLSARACLTLMCAPHTAVRCTRGVWCGDVSQVIPRCR
jgi:hypothetical protein